MCIMMPSFLKETDVISWILEKDYDLPQDLLNRCVSYCSRKGFLSTLQLLVRKFGVKIGKEEIKNALEHGAISILDWIVSDYPELASMYLTEGMFETKQAADLRVDDINDKALIWNYKRLQQIASS